MSSQGVSYYTAQEGGQGTSAAHGAYASDSVPYFSTVPYRGGSEKRDARKCVANDFTCKGWKTKDSDLCAGHLKSYKANKEEAADDSNDEG